MSVVHDVGMACNSPENLRKVMEALDWVDIFSCYSTLNPFCYWSLLEEEKQACAERMYAEIVEKRKHYEKQKEKEI